MELAKSVGGIANISKGTIVSPPLLNMLWLKALRIDITLTV
jgi:hypothetical protein